MPAFLIIFILTVLLVRGIKESAEANNVMVLIKIGAILIFLVVGGALVNPATGSRLRPPDSAASLLAAPSSSSPTSDSIPYRPPRRRPRNPQRDLPFGIIASLIVCTLLYVGVSDRAAGHDEVHDLRFGRSR